MMGADLPRREPGTVALAETPTPQDINPRIPVAKFDQFRPHQWEGVESVLEALHSKVKVVFVAANTGSGKTLLAETVRSSLWESDSSPYLCTTLTLQDQILHDFPYARVLKGRGNYPTRLYPEGFPTLSCEDCDARPTKINEDDVPEWLEEDVRVHGLWRVTRRNPDGDLIANRCDMCNVQALCPYITARDEAVSADLCVTNTAFYFREANGPGRLAGRKLVIVDEADSLFEKILDTFTVTVPKYLLMSPGCPVPRTASNDDDIQDWITAMVGFLQGEVSSLERNKRANIEKMGAKKYRRRLNSLNQLLTNLTIAGEDDKPWVYKGPSLRARKSYDTAELKPVWVGDWVKEFVWQHAEQWTLMSASFVSIDSTAQMLGLKAGEYAKVVINYQFPPERRPIRYWPSIQPYTRKAEKEGFDSMRDAANKIRTILGWYPTERVLIHTVSHARANRLLELLGDVDREMLALPPGAVARENTISKYRSTPAAVLMGAGLERGYDFPYDDCRVCILVKTPYADFSDPVVAARVHDGPMGRTWYDLDAVRSTVQMVGRGMRAEDDWLVTYILDRSFEKFLRGASNKYFPETFMGAVRFGRPLGREAIADS